MYMLALTSILKKVYDEFLVSLNQTSLSTAFFFPGKLFSSEQYTTQHAQQLNILTFSVETKEEALSFCGASLIST